MANETSTRVRGAGSIERRAELGVLPVAEDPKYHDPMSVNFPSCVSIAAFGPTLDTELLKEPK